MQKAKFGRKADDIDYSQLYKEQGRLLRLAYSRSDIGHNAELRPSVNRTSGGWMTLPCSWR